MPNSRLFALFAASSVLIACAADAAPEGDEVVDDGWAAKSRSDDLTGLLDRYQDMVHSLRVDLSLGPRESAIALGEGASLTLPADGHLELSHGVNGITFGERVVSSLIIRFRGRPATLRQGRLAVGIDAIAWDCDDDKVVVDGHGFTPGLQPLLNTFFQDSFPQALRRCDGPLAGGAGEVEAARALLTPVLDNVERVELNVQFGPQRCTGSDPCWQLPVTENARLDYYRRDTNALDFRIVLQGPLGRLRLESASIAASDGRLYGRNPSNWWEGLRLFEVALDNTGPRPQVRIDYSVYSADGSTIFDLWRDGSVTLAEDRSGHDDLSTRQRANEILEGVVVLVPALLERYESLVPGMSMREIAGLTPPPVCRQLDACLDTGGGEACWDLKCGAPAESHPVCGAVLGCLKADGGAGCFRRDCGLVPDSLTDAQLSCLGPGDGGKACFNRR